MRKLKLPLQKNLLFVIAFALLLGATGWFWYNGAQAQKKIAQLSTAEGQQKQAQKETDSITAAISKHMILPDNEKPTLATVTDIETLKKSQPFFEKAQNGDKVLVYVAAKKVVVYRPSTDLIVNVGLIAVNETTPATSTITKSDAAKLAVEIRNGTNAPGIGQKIADGLTAAYNIQKISDGRIKTYAKTMVIDLNKTSDKASIAALAKELQADVVTALPDGETNTTASVLVILGADKANL